jgi:hypothetical protein
MPVLRNPQPRHGEGVLTVWEADVRRSGRSTGASRCGAAGWPSALLQVPKATSSGKPILRLLRSTPAGSRPCCTASAGAPCRRAHPADAAAGGAKTRSPTASRQAGGKACAPAASKAQAPGRRAATACACTTRTLRHGSACSTSNSTTGPATRFSHGGHSVVHGPACARGRG